MVITMSSKLKIRSAIQADLNTIVDLYNDYITDTPITFDLQPFTLDQRQAWFDQYRLSGLYRLFVAELGGQVVGYASSSEFNSKAAYASSIEVSVYLHQSATGKGIGAELYKALFDALKEEPIHRAYALITQPNPASNALHINFGFQQIGLLNEVGWKFEQFWDVAWYEKEL